MVDGLRIPSGVIVAAKAADPNVDTSLTAGDVIHAVNGASITTIDSLRSVLDHMGSDSPVVLQVEREESFCSSRFIGLSWLGIEFCGQVVVVARVRPRA